VRRRALLAALPFLPRVALACGRLDPGQILRGRFVQTRTLQGFDRPLISEGRFVLAAGRGLIWRAEKPFAVTTLISGAGIVQLVQGNEALRLPASRMPMLGQLYDMLGGAMAGDWRALERDFAVASSGAEQAWQVTLTPRRPDNTAMPFTAINASGGCLVESVELLKPDGDADRLRFVDQSLTAGPLDAEESAALALLPQ
jgi:hypothetical protein